MSQPDSELARVIALPVQVDLCRGCQKPARLFVYGLCPRCVPSSREDRPS